MAELGALLNLYGRKLSSPQEFGQHLRELVQSILISQSVELQGLLKGYVFEPDSLTDAANSAPDLERLECEMETTLMTVGSFVLKVKEAKSQRFQTTHAVAKKKLTEKKETVERLQAKLEERRAKKDLDK